MNKKNLLYILLLVFLTYACNSNDLTAVKRGLTGAKDKSADEFLVEKKDPLILPPNYDELPSPDRSIEDVEKISSFEKKLTKTSAFEEEEFLSTESTEDSILKKIRKK
tara:strand:- start:209 stop:532 length:324 start_codon:yes stop_codon:yes gene_type:complete